MASSNNENSGSYFFSRARDKERDFVRDDGLQTESSLEQMAVEGNVEAAIDSFRKVCQYSTRLEIVLNRRLHADYLHKGCSRLPSYCQELDASCSWLSYWILHSLELLEEPLYENVRLGMVEFLSNCQHPTGGFGGGPGQQPHLAPTYSSVNALCIVGTLPAYKTINRQSLYSFLMRMRQPDGSFTMHEGGEVDLRGAYCALSVAKLTNIYTDELFKGTADWILKCQTYEGGFGGVPGLEAHGGYSFCGLAALILLNSETRCDLQRLLRWLVNCQMRYEGGFQGRTNKLVDACYAFWQGGAFPLIHRALKKSGVNVPNDHWLFNQVALQEYVLLCCQNPMGGLIDKPGKPRDFYHTCYALSGLSVAQHFHCPPDEEHNCVVGDRNNLLAPTHPLFNIGAEAAKNALEFFESQPPIQTSTEAT